MISEFSPTEHEQPHSGQELKLERLVDAIQELSLASTLASVMEIVRAAANELTGADGTTFILREGDSCYYADEIAIAPLWKGQRFPLSHCVSGWVMENRESCLIEDIATDPRVPQDVYASTFVRSMLMVPIRTRAPLGAIGNYWARTHAPSPTDTRLLEALANAAAVALDRLKAYEELEKTVEERTRELKQTNRQLHVEVNERRRAEDEVRRLSSLDPLTGLLNRRGFLERAVEKLERLRGSGTPAMLLFADVDGLKRVNDTRGHAVGDQLLRDYAAVLGAVFRDTDAVGRLGGDEFAVLAETDNPVALRQRLQAHLAEFNATAGRPYTISASLGYISLDSPATTTQPLTDLLADADRRMYAIKPGRR